jgi:hypothetical protein
VSTLWTQLLTDPMLAQRYPDAGSRALGLLAEHQRYFHSRDEVAFAVLVILVVGATSRLTSLRSSPLVPFTVGLAGSLAVLAPNKQAYYALPLVPYLALMAAAGLLHGLPRLGRVPRAALVALLGLYVVNGAARFTSIIATNEDVVSRNEALARHLAPGATVVATLPFVFDEIENRTVLGLEYYWVKSGYGRRPLPPETLFEDARQRGARYAILSREDLKFSGWPDGALGPSGPHYRRLHEDDHHLILELF